MHRPLTALTCALDILPALGPYCRVIGIVHCDGVGRCIIDKQFSGRFVQIL